MRSQFTLTRNLRIWGQDYAPLWHALSRRRKSQLLGFVVLSLLSAIAEVGNLGALMPFLRLLANPKDGLAVLGPWAQPLVGLEQNQLLLLLGLGFLLMVTVSAALRILANYGQLKLTALLGADLGRQVLADVLQRPYAWHVRRNSSMVLGTLTNDVRALVASIQSILGLVVNGLIALLLLGALLSLSPSIMTTVVGFLALFYVVVYHFTRGSLVKDGWTEAREYAATLQVAQEALGGIRDVLLGHTQEFFLKRYDHHNRQYRLAFYRINHKAQVPRYLIESVAMALIAGVALVLALRGEGMAQILPLLGTLALGAYRLLQPVQQCFNTFSLLKANQAAWHNIRPYLQSTRGYSVPLPACPEADPAPGIEFERVSFRYNADGPWIVQDLSFSIPAGSRVALVGSTGSGKSTTTDLLLGLLAPDQGRILVNAQDLHQSPEHLEQWQQQLAHVPQQIYLSDGSFAENIAFGIPAEAIDMRRVRRAAEQACLADLIDQQPQGYATVVGERGIRLSGGQRQRLGIARALYQQAALMVLDEATSALDNRTETRVMQSLSELSYPLTVVMIAHRLSTIRDCDCIFLLEQGRLQAQGTYEQLLVISPQFRRLAAAVDSNQEIPA